MNITKRRILLITLLVEGALVAVYLTWAYLSDSLILAFPSPLDLLKGVMASVPLLLMNFYLFSDHASQYPPLKAFHDYKDEVVRPVVSVLDPFSGLFVSIAAGAGEELFFRGLLMEEIGIPLSSAIFALLHFPMANKKLLGVILTYWVIGMYFSWLYLTADTLWVPVITHAFYDFVAIIYLLYFDNTPTPSNR